MPLVTGTILGPYRITAKIGEGGMGQVYRARDTKLDRDVALKVLPEAFTSDSDRLARFEREAKVLASLNHQNIGGIHGFEEDEGTKALVLELVDGPTLEDRIAQGPIPVDEALSIAKQIAEALEAAHDAGVIHRDLKPANIKVREDGTLKVLDFGLAKALDTAPEADPNQSPTLTAAATQMGAIMGTAAYMSPEQARGKAVDKRADVWAFGVVLFELLAARRLFADGDSVSDTLAAVLREAVPWGRLPASTSPRMRRLLARCLERDPRRRLRDIGEARVELDDELAGVDPPAVVTIDEPATARAPGRRERIAWAVTGLAMVAAGAAWLTRPAPAPVSDSTAWRSLTQLTDQSGVEDTPTISPDGTTLAFSRAVDAGWDLFVQRIGGHTQTMVAGDPKRNERWPAFSPDSQTIAFHEEDANGGLFVVGATGENVRRLTDEGFHPAFSPDGRSIVYCTEPVLTPYVSGPRRSELWVVDVESGDRRKIFDGGDARQPAWSPSGTRLAFWGGGPRDIFTVAADGGDLRAVVEDAALDWGATWAPDGRHLYFSSERGGTMSLWRIAIDEATGETRGGPEPVITGVGPAPELPSFSADGRRLVFRSQQSTTNPVAVDFDPATLVVGAWRYLTQRTTGALMVTDVSSDGQWLALWGGGDIHIIRNDGSDLRRLTDDLFPDQLPRWAPDGESLVFNRRSTRNGRFQAWRIHRDGSALTQVTETTAEEGSLLAPFFHPSGDRLFGSTGSTRRFVSVDPNAPSLPLAPTELPQPALPDGGDAIRLWLLSPSPNGRLVAGAAQTATNDIVGVGVYDLDTGDARLVSRETTYNWLPAWLPDGRRLIYTVTVDGEPAFAVVDLDDDERRVIEVGSLDVSGSGVVASPDGRTLYVSAVDETADIWMVEREP